MSDPIIMSEQEKQAAFVFNEYVVDELERQVEDFRAHLMLKAEDIGWLLLEGDKWEEHGPELRHIKEISERAREKAIANPLIKRAVGLRQSYVWSKPPTYEGVDLSPNGGRPSKVQKFFKNQTNQKHLLSSDAHERMEAAAITDGCYILLGDKSSKVVRPIPLDQIVDVEVDPDFPDTIRAYKREWSTYENGKPKPMRAWYYVEDVPKSERATSIGEAPADVPVDDRYEILDFWVNTQVGWTFGLPDALAALPWVQNYTELMQAGKTMTDALAKFAGKITSKTKAGSSNVGAKLASARGSGKMASLAEGNEMEILASAGKTYDFDGLRPVAAMVATGMEVSLVHLLSDPGAAGSSYGSASNLDMPTQRAVVQRQDAWKRFLERVLLWATGQEIPVTFPSTEEADVYRQAQTVQMAWNSGLFSPEEIRERMAAVVDLELKGDKAPDGVLIPNNVMSAQRKDIDLENPNATAASPDQGRSGAIPTGGVDSSLENDERTDTLS